VAVQAEIILVVAEILSVLLAVRVAVASVIGIGIVIVVAAAAIFSVAASREISPT
jgi:hypothetical protein